jgi:tetratricopeptide (TPR) repeat protein
LKALFIILIKINNSIMPERDNQAAIKILIETLKVNPELWDTRKKTAEILFDEEQYVEAAEVLWGAPEIPSTDTDVAFVIKLVSRAQPNRAIRMIYEIVRRNNGKPAKNMAVARALNDIGMYMQAARFYGAALASDPSLFDLAFERQVLWLDDSNRLLEEWKQSNQDSKPPLDVPQQEIYGGTFAPLEIPENIEGQDLIDNVKASSGSSVATPTNPLLAAAQTNGLLVTSTTSPSSTEGTPMASPAPVRHAARAVPTQPLQVASVKAAPNPANQDATKETVEPYTAIGPSTGKLLTPTASNRPQFKFR